MLGELYLEAHADAPQQIVLDIDTTDIALHGGQEGRSFHGFYGHYCYLPLFIFCGDHVLCARLRRSNAGPAVGSREELARIATRTRQRWPEVPITLRGDSGFCTDEIMSWCEQQRVHYVLGLARNARLERMVAPTLAEAQRLFDETQQPARVFCRVRARDR